MNQYTSSRIDDLFDQQWFSIDEKKRIYLT